MPDNLEPTPPPSEPSEQSPHPPYPPPQEAFLVLMISLVAALIAGVALVKIEKIGVVLTEVLFLVPPLIYLRRKGYNLFTGLRWNRISVSVIFASLLIGLSLTVLLDEVDRLIAMFFPMPEELQNNLLGFLTLETWSDYLLAGLGVVAAAAICEESLFRGFIQVSLEAHGPVTRAVLFSSLLFAMAHFNPWWMVQILILGVFLGFLSWRSNSSIPGMFIHGINNGLALYSGGSLTGGPWVWYNMGEHVSPMILIAALALLFLGMKLFVKWTDESAPIPLESESLGAGGP